MAIELPEYIAVGEVVKVNGWHGVIVDVLTSDTRVMVLVKSPKMIFRNGATEWLEWTLNPQAWERGSVIDIYQETQLYIEQARGKLLELLDFSLGFTHSVSVEINEMVDSILLERFISKR